MRFAFFTILSVLLIALSYLVFRVLVCKDYQRKQGLSAFSIMAQILVFALHANLSYIFLPTQWPYLPAFPESIIHTAVGLVVLGVGLLTTLWAMSGLGFRNAFGQRSSGLHRSGFYRYSRNPQLVAYGVALSGIVILWPSFYGVGWLLIYAAISHMMVRTEEEHLEEIFGTEYEEYCEEVPRYLSF